MRSPWSHRVKSHALFGGSWAQVQELTRRLEFLHSETRGPALIMADESTLESILPMIKALAQTFDVTEDEPEPIPSSLQDFLHGNDLDIPDVGYYPLMTPNVLVLDCNTDECQEMKDQLNKVTQGETLPILLVRGYPALIKRTSEATSHSETPCYPSTDLRSGYFDPKAFHENTVLKQQQVIKLLNENLDKWTYSTFPVIVLMEISPEQWLERAPPRLFASHNAMTLRSLHIRENEDARERVESIVLKMARNMRQISHLKFEPSLDDIIRAVANDTVGIKPIEMDHLVDALFQTLVHSSAEASESEKDVALKMADVYTALAVFTPHSLRTSQSLRIGQYIGYRVGKESHLLAQGKQLPALSPSSPHQELMGLERLVLDEQHDSTNKVRRLIEEFSNKYGHMVHWKRDSMSPKVTPCEEHDGTLSKNCCIIQGCTGTGKTALALAIAETLHLPALLLQGSSIRKSVVGETERALADFFSDCQALSPLAVVIEDLELVVPSQAPIDSHSYWQRTRLRRILIDGIQSLASAPILIMLITSEEKSTIFPMDQIDPEFLDLVVPCARRIWLPNMRVNKNKLGRNYLMKYLHGRLDPSITEEEVDQFLETTTLPTNPAEAVHLVSEASARACHRYIADKLEGRDMNTPYLVFDDVIQCTKNM